MSDCLCLPSAIRGIAQPQVKPSRPMMIPNSVTIRPGMNDIHRIESPAMIWPLQCPDDMAGMIAYPMKGEGTPSSQYVNERSMNGFNVPGFYGVYLPYPGDWKVFFFGGSAVACVILDEANPMVSTIRDPGCYAQGVSSVASVGVASGTVLSANPFADYRVFQNDSANTIYLRLGAAAVVNVGIRLNPNGGSYEMSRKFGNLWRGAVRAIATAAASNLMMTEGGTPSPT